MIKNLLENCLRLEKRKVRFLSVVLALSVLLNLLLSVLLGVTLSYKASEVKRQTSATASAAVMCSDNIQHITKEGAAWDRSILRLNTHCRTCRKKNLKVLSTDFCSPKNRKK